MYVSRPLAVDTFVRYAAVREQPGDTVEVGGVDAFRVVVHERRDRVVALPGTRTHDGSPLARSIDRVTNVPFAPRLPVETTFDSIGVDTPDDLERVRAIVERGCVPGDRAVADTR